MRSTNESHSSASASQNLMRKHAGLFPSQQESGTSNMSKAMTQGTPSNNLPLFSPNPNKESSPIMEENSCSDNLSNLGQGSPMKKLAPQQQPLAPMTSAFDKFNKSMTPMPKLVQAFSQPLPRKGSNNSNEQGQPQPQTTKQAQFQAEYQSKDRVQGLKQDLTETPNSKYKYKQISREMKEQEKNGFQAVIKDTFQRILNIPRKVHWRVVLDLADYAKRESRFREAKVLFKLVSYLQPYAY
mmetsp:Transcript_35806/g.47116  ORF Transcript_35806/g.47116 Transcript_35806/m.47116 type:complete len:241 (-) Transcript_35806:1951-2673(-)